MPDIDQQYQISFNFLYKFLNYFLAIFHIYLKLSIYSHLNIIQDRLTDFQQEHVDDVAQLLTDTFLKNNSIWSSSQLTSEILFPFFVQTTIENLEAQQRARDSLGKQCVLNMFIVIQGKMRSDILHYEIQQYNLYCQKSKESLIPLFQSLELIGRQLSTAIDLNSLEKGKYVYSNFAGSDDYFIENKMNVQAIVSFLEELDRQGFNAMICRSSNIKVIKILQKLGGQLLKEASYQVDQKSYPLFFIIIDFRNPLMQAVLAKWRQKLTKGVFPKL